MDEIETENSASIPENRTKIPLEAIFESQSMSNSPIKELNCLNKNTQNFYHSRVNKRSKISIEMIFDDENVESKLVPICKSKNELHSEDEISIEEIDDIFKKSFVKQKNAKYSIDDILSEENLSQTGTSSYFQKKIENKNLTNEVIQEISQNLEFDKILNKKSHKNIEYLDELFRDSSPLSKKKYLTFKNTEHDDEIEEDLLDTFKLKSKSKKIVNVDDILKDEKDVEFTIKEKKQVDFLSILTNVISLEEDETILSKKTSINDPHLSSQEKYSQNLIDIRDDLSFCSQFQGDKPTCKKAKWIQEINLKLDESSVFNLGNESNILANSSNFLSQIENKKKKIKFIKNGYADKLQKLLIRQKSAINFIKHNIDKKSTADRLTQKSKNLTNVVKLIPFYRQNFLSTKFILVHALNVENELDISLGNFSYLLLSNDEVDYSSYFGTDVIQLKYFINIYPPWRKFLMKNTDKIIYFSTNLIEIFPIGENNAFYEKFNVIRKDISSFSLNGLNCPSCIDSNTLNECSLNLFDPKKYMDILRNNMKQKKKLFISQKNCFITQSASDFLTQNIQTNTQFLQMNSILDALENIGYYGFTNFRATVQRIGLVKNNNISLYHSQRTQTQYDENQYRRQVIVSDKIGLFALIVFPLNVDSCYLNESYEYEFNAIKFVEKQNLGNKENSDLNDQIVFLCKKLNLKRENRSKTSPKSVQKFIYIFEFISINRSFLTELGSSKEFLPKDSFLSLQNVVWSNIEKYWFNLYDVILIKMHFNEEKKDFLIFFMEKMEFLSNIDLNVKKIRMQSLFHIKDKAILSKLNENYILFRSYFEDQNSVICLKNIGLNNSNNDYSVIFGSFSTIESADLNEYNSITKSNTKQTKDKIIQNSIFERKLALWINDIYLKAFDFGLVKGNVINVCEENCCFDFYCQICHNNSLSSELIAQSQLNFDQTIKSWVCNFCGTVSEIPLIKIQIQVILNCVGISRKFYLKLHKLTIKKFFNTEDLIKKFTEEDESNFNISTLIDKQIGPVPSFITKINDSEIYAEEISLDL